MVLNLNIYAVEWACEACAERGRCHQRGEDYERWSKDIAQQDDHESLSSVFWKV